MNPEWLTIPALLAFVVALIAIGKPLIALNNTILKLSLAVEQLQKTVDQNQKVNNEAHDVMFQKLRIHDEQLAEMRGQLCALEKR